MLLVNTAYWNQLPLGEDILCLGEWCRIYGEDGELKSATVLPYHWDDRAKAQRDAKYLQELRHRFLPVLADELNTLHNTNYSISAWHLQIGYWLAQFLTVAFDRWSMLETASNLDTKLESLVLDVNPRALTPFDTAQAGAQFIDDYWNEVFISQLLNEFSDIKQKTTRPQECYVNDVGYTYSVSASSRRFKSKVKWLFTKSISIVSRISSRSSLVYVLVSSGLRPKGLLDLLRLLPGSIFVDPEFPVIPKPGIEEGMRNWELSAFEPNSQFESMLSSLMSLWMPSVFIEAFEDLKASIDSAKLPQNPNVILTATGQFGNDVFKHWAATQRENGCKLVVAQHGGGLNAFNGALSYESEICDLYAASGNGGCRLKFSRDVGQFRGTAGFEEWDPNGIALVVTVAMPRYTFDLRSMAIAGQMLSYFEDQFSFYGNLSSSVQANTIIRLQNTIVDDKWNVPQRWIDRFPSVDLDAGLIPMKDIIRKTRIFISTYNATTYHESLSANIPTVIYWDKNLWEWPDWAESDFNDLRSVGIFHDSTTSAAKHVEKVWDDVSSWWLDPELQAIRREFCRKYAFRDPCVIRKLASVLREAAK